MSIEYINPDGMLKSPAFSQGIIIPAGACTDRRHGALALSRHHCANVVVGAPKSVLASVGSPISVTFEK